MKNKLPNVLIIEGPDGCGKTHIAQYLAKTYGYSYFKNEVEWSHFRDANASKTDIFTNLVKYADPYFISYLKSTQARVILDRAYPSEWVYSQVFNRKTDFEAIKNSDKLYNEIGALHIRTKRSSYEKVSDQFNEVTMNIKLIDKYYDEFYKITDCKVVNVYVDSEDLIDEHRQIMEQL